MSAILIASTAAAWADPAQGTLTPSPDPTPAAQAALKPEKAKVDPAANPTNNPATNPAANPSTATATTPKKPAVSTASSAPPSMPPAAPSIKDLNRIGELEKVMFGKAQPEIPTEYRLDRLESEVFHQTNPEWTAQDRIARLEKTVLGKGDGPTSAGAAPVSPDPRASLSSAYPPAGVNPYFPPMPTGGEQPDAGQAPPAEAHNYIPAPGDLSSPEFQTNLPRQQLEQFALKLVNDARLQQGLSELSWDDTSYKVSKELVNDLCKRNTVSHDTLNGDNPDVRYTQAGGTDCMVESVVGIRLKGRPHPNKELVYDVLKELASHQDDRDALLSKYASQLAFTFDISSDNGKIIACAETVTKQATLAPIPPQVHVGDKLDVKGVLLGPYKFAKITLAWEGKSQPDDSDDQIEASPYFPPLDFEAYAKRSEHDFQKSARILTIAGIGLALAGSVFMPPVALAAPLIAAATSNVRPKPISEIPVRGGVKLDGNTFEFKMPISKDNKEGIYYITVWAQSEAEQAPFAISRRAVLASTMSAEPEMVVIDKPKQDETATANSQSKDKGK